MPVPFLHQPGDEIELLDLVACCAFTSATSISFDLNRRSPGMLNGVGWLDVHHPCDDPYIKAQLRVWLPAEYERSDLMEQLVREVFAALAIPSNEVYELSFLSGGRHVGFSNRKDSLGGRLCDS
ncbi:hypothetical protein [Aquisphaera insulae]|uniref:hypothetical protein n=1 Tax=Aquisphaera insulae TaxID=2712864 RepID=UPI0013EA0B05|nr:hypothetical protein [Aquisphaera insulae]